MNDVKMLQLGQFPVLDVNTVMKWQRFENLCFTKCPKSMVAARTGSMKVSHFHSCELPIYISKFLRIVNTTVQKLEEKTRLVINPYAFNQGNAEFNAFA